MTAIKQKLVSPPVQAVIHAVVLGTRRLGPGIRAGIWFQGCPFRCYGCIAPGALPFDRGTTVDVNEIAHYIEACDGLDGVTYSGGEPFAQSEALAVLLERAIARGLGTIVFSGYRLQQLRRCGTQNASVGRALASIDLLIDGLYVDARNVGNIMRGSDNQMLHFLTNRYVGDRIYFEAYDRTAFEIRPTLAGEAMLVGVPTRQANTVWTVLGG